MQTLGDNGAILIPAYNAEETLANVLKGIDKHCDVGFKLVMNDGSTDRTAKVAETAGAMVISHDTNQGKGAALRSGFHWLLSRGFSFAVTLDADGQHAPEEIPRLITNYHSHKDHGLVIGSRFSEGERDKIPPYRYYPNRIGKNILSKMCGQALEDVQCGFRVYNLQMIEKAYVLGTHFEFETEITLEAIRLGYRVTFVPIQTIYPENERAKTHFKPVRDTYRISIMALRWYLRNRFGGR